MWQHDKLVTGLDWAVNSNRIVSCSQDRNAYVWRLENDEWKPSLVLLRINRAATCVSWSPKENKFAVGSGARCISVCYFEEDKDWWVSKHIKKPIRSTILSIKWHPNNVLLAASSSDMKARVFSAFIKGVDDKPEPTVWGEKIPFNTVCADYSASAGWIHSIAFSPSGNGIAWVAHDSSLNVAYPGENYLFTLKTTFLPFMALLWISETSIVVAGHDSVPILITKSGNDWKIGEKIDQGAKRNDSVDTARNMFKQMDSRGQAATNDLLLDSCHQNSITCLCALESKNGIVTRFSSTGVDGKLVCWDSSSFSALRIK